MRRKLITTTIFLLIVFFTTGVIFALNGYFTSDEGAVGLNEASLTQGLVAYWNFEDGSGTTTIDHSNNSNTGTLIAMATSTNGGWTTGKAGNGGVLDFDGSDDYVNISDSSSFDITSEISISAWALFRDNATGDQQHIVSRDHSASGSPYIDWALNQDGPSNDKMEFALQIDGALHIAESSVVPTINVWHHYVGTYDGSTMKLYEDVIEIATKSVSGSITDTNKDVQIGAEDDAGTIRRVIDGQIDEVRIYNRALSAAEIRMLYNRGGPVGHWKFDEGTGTTAFDSVGSNDGTLTSMTDADWVAGKHGTALDFDGSNDYVDVSSFTHQTNFTYSTWIYPRASNGNIFEERIDAGDIAFFIENDQLVLGWWLFPETELKGGAVVQNTWDK
jgi:hypothetical protein